MNFQNWTDDFLKWNPSDYGGINRIVLPPKSVWRPDFGIVNRSGSKLKQT